MTVDPRASAVKRLTNRNRKIRELIAQYKDWNTTGSMDKRIAQLRSQLKDNSEQIGNLRRAR